MCRLAKILAARRGNSPMETLPEQLRRSHEQSAKMLYIALADAGLCTFSHFEVAQAFGIQQSTAWVARKKLCALELLHYHSKSMGRRHIYSVGIAPYAGDARALLEPLPEPLLESAPTSKLLWLWMQRSSVKRALQPTARELGIAYAAAHKGKKRLERLGMLGDVG